MCVVAEICWQAFIRCANVSMPAAQTPDDAVHAGIDVGAPAKGFHAVALCGSRIVDTLASRDVAQVVDWCLRWQVRAVGVDAPVGWSIDGHARPAERALMRQGVHCFASPTRERALAHPGNWYAWMFSGEAIHVADRKSTRLNSSHT